MTRAAWLGLALLLSACGTTVAPITYTPTASITPGNGQVTVGKATDDRRDYDPTWYGAIRGGFGNPIKTLRADTPIADVAARAFRAALTARGMLSPSAGRFDVRLSILRFESNRVARLEAHAAIDVTVVDTSTGQTVFRQQALGDKVSGSLLALDNGVFASTSELTNLMAAAMSTAIDRIVDDPGFRRAVSGGAPSV